MKSILRKMIVAGPIAFILFPIGYVLAAQGFTGEVVASMLMMFFIQFISPQPPWLIPLAASFVVAELW